MQETSALYKRLLSEPHQMETSLAVGDTGRLITERNETISFGGVNILVARSGADSGYRENILKSISTNGQVFAEDKPVVGGCISGEIDIEMFKPVGELPRMAQVVPYVRLTNGEEYSEWIQKGVYFIDTRETNTDDAGVAILTIHGYDAMLKAEQDYTGANLSWPNTDINVVKDIASLMGISVDTDTVRLINMGYTVQLPAGYTCREVLGYIAASYAGCFIISDVGELKLVTLSGIPKETRLLVDNVGYAITFGGTRILV